MTGNLGGGPERAGHRERERNKERKNEAMPSDLAESFRHDVFLSVAKDSYTSDAHGINVIL